MRRATPVHVHVDVRVFVDNQAGGSRVIEVDVRDEQPTDIAESDPSVSIEMISFVAISG